jgi:autotransporter-associated beta strand protein
MKTCGVKSIGTNRAHWALCVAFLAVNPVLAATYYWDNDGTTPGFGTASGTWTVPTTSLWSLDGTGSTAPEASVTTTTSDLINWGNGATGLGAGTITVSGAVNSGNMTFASGSGTIVLSGGTSITLPDAAVITVDNASDTISTPLAGAATSLTKAGNGTLTLGGGGSLTGNVIVAAGTLKLGADNGLSTSAGLQLFGGALATRIFDLNGFDQTLSLFTGTQTNVPGNLTITGGPNSKLTINATANTLLGAVGATGYLIPANCNVIADLSGIGEFIWNGGSNYSFDVSHQGANSPSTNPGTNMVLLADTNTITGSQVRVGYSGLSNHGGTSILRLGQSNSLNANSIGIGTGARNFTILDFRNGLTGTPTVTLRGTDGSSAVTTWDVGRVSHSANSTWWATNDFTAGQIDAVVSSLRIGRADTGSSTGRAGTQNSTFIMGKGSLTVTNLIIGQYAGLSGSTLVGSGIFVGNGTFNLNDATGTVIAGDIILGDNIGLTTGGTTKGTSGTLNLNAGVLEAKSIGKGADTGNATSKIRNFNFSGGTVRNYSGFDLSIANIPINLTGSGTRVFEATAGQMITVASNSVISGSAQGFTKTGAGTLTFTGSNTYGGNTVISEGTLALGATGSITNSAAIVVAPNAIFDVSARTTPFTLAVSLSSQTLSNSAPGALVSGTNNCSAGTLSLVYDGVNPCFIQTNGTMTLSASTQFKVTNIGAQLQIGTYTLIKKTTTGSSGSVAGSLTDLTITVGGNGTAELATLSVTNNELVLTVAVGNVTPVVAVTVGNYVYNGSPQGPSTYTTNPEGDLGTPTWSYEGVSLSYGPSATPPTEVGQYQATVALEAYGNFNAATSSPTAFTIDWPSGATVRWVADSAQPWSTTAAWQSGVVPKASSIALFDKSTPTYAPSLTTDASIGGMVFSNATTFGSGNAILSLGNAYPGGVGIWVAATAGAVDLGSAKIELLADQCWQNNSASALTIRGEISGAFNITNTGPGKVTLTAANTYTGTTVIDAGTLEVQGHIGSSSSISNNASLIINNAATRTYSMVISGSGSLTKTNGPLLYLYGNNTYSGGTLFADGTLYVGVSKALGTGDLVFNGEAVGMYLGNGVALQNNITIGRNAGVAGTGLLRVNDGETATVSGTITINNSASGGGHFGCSSVNGNGVLNLTGPINSTVNVSHRNGIVVFSGGGSYTSISAGQNTIRLGADNGLSTNATLTIGGSGTAYFDLAGYSQTLAGVQKASNAAIIGNSSTTTDSTLTTTGTKTYAGFIQDTLGTNTVTRKVGLTVNGGSLTLTATNSYTGPTAVSAGTLTLATNNAISAATTVSLGSGTLDTQTYSNKVSTLAVTGSATINLGIGGKLVFADSHLTSWTGTLTITGDFIPGSSIRFGTSKSALTRTQVSRIRLTSNNVVDLNEEGFLIYGRGTIIHLL